jgi:trehalose-6-phosphate synthase
MTENPATMTSMLAPHRVKPYHFKGLNDFEYDLGRQELWQRYVDVNSAFAKCIIELK